MYVERSMKDALQDYLEGRKVIVITEYDDESLSIEKLEDILAEDDLHYLVDVDVVPAVENPVFEKDVQDITKNVTKKVPSPEQIIEAVHETQNIPYTPKYQYLNADTFDTRIPDTGVGSVP